MKKRKTGEEESKRCDYIGNEREGKDSDCKYSHMQIGHELISHLRWSEGGAGAGEKIKGRMTSSPNGVECLKLGD